MDYKNKFEETIANWLSNNGWRVIRSVYAMDECQIDIVALGRGFLCLELKGYYVKWLKPLENAHMWPYIDYRQKKGRMLSPVKQNEKHVDLLYKHVNLNLPDKRIKIPRPISVSIINGDFYLDKNISNKLNLFNLTNLNEINDRFGGYDKIDNWNILDDILYGIIKEASDTSESRLNEHIEFLRKQRKVG